MPPQHVTRHTSYVTLLHLARTNTPARARVHLKGLPCDTQRRCDVIMPASPFFLYHSPSLLQLLLSPLLLHAANKTKMPYNNTWGIHDLGTWPICDETPYGQEQMPIEETANM
jgi:hypothetical protein